MAIQSVEVKRDHNGMWTHPDLPNWGESISRSELKEWEEENGITVNLVSMDGDAPEELVDRWFEDGDCDCSEWKPTPPSADSFLLSIHDTEDGPYSWWATPVNQ
jgi:hypothetical protein